MTRALHFHSEVHRAFHRARPESRTQGPGRVALPHRLLLGPRPPVPGGPAVARAGSPLPQLAGRGRRPQVAHRAQPRQPQLLPEPGPGPARALVLHQQRHRRPREAALRGRALSSSRDGFPSTTSCYNRAGGEV
ncbi:hypothetical protein U0070_017587 [Myodes glareolus]|uniref:Uncharacterized protein n=1 Tax=Myodes glareolus TaxID=447135 RepID=A0AAW0K7A8_MYOGA